TVEYFVAYVDDSALARRSKRSLPSVFRFANTSLVRELAAELLTGLGVQDADRDREQIDAATILLCAQAVRGREGPPRVDLDAPLPDDERLARAVALAREKFREGIATRALASAAGMSTRSFERA